MTQPRLPMTPSREKGEDRITSRRILEAWSGVRSEILGHSGPPVGDKGRKHWRPSALGNCYRAQVMWRRGVPPRQKEQTPEEIADREKRFEWGRQLEQFYVEAIELSGLLISPQVTLTDLDLEVEGHLDAMWGGVLQSELPQRSRYWSPEYAWAVRTLRGRVMEMASGDITPITGTEVKSTHSYAVRMARKEGMRFGHRMQIASYKLMADRHPEQLPVPIERFELALVGRDYVNPLIFGITRNDAAEALERIEKLNQLWRDGELPDCTCLEGPESPTYVGYQQAKYCQFQNEDGDGCCNWRLLDQLERSVEKARA